MGRRSARTRSGVREPSPKEGRARPALDATSGRDARTQLRPRARDRRHAPHAPTAAYNIAKRMLIHVAGFNLGLLMRKRFGAGTPRGLQGRVIAAMAAFAALIDLISDLLVVPGYRHPEDQPARIDSTWLTPELLAA